MHELPTRSIALSSKKLLLLLLGSLSFVAIGMWLMASPRSHWLMMLVGGIGIAFFGACGWVAVKKLMDRRPGLIVDAQGVTDNSSGVSAGLTAWADIASVKPSFVSGQKFVSLVLHDPAAYIERGNAAQKYLGEMNVKLVGTPVNISANSLSIDFEELLALLQTYHQASQRSGTTMDDVDG